MTTPKNPEEFALWQLERRMVDDLLAKVERTEHAMLTEIGCPTDVVAVYAILNGERPAPWPARTAERDKARALHAMHTLVQISTTRQHLGLVNGNPRLAAHAALLAGLHANGATIDAVLGRAIRAKNSQNASRGVTARRETQATNDAELMKAVNAFRARHPNHSRHAMALSLVAQFGRTDDAPATDDRSRTRRRVAALEKRIARLPHLKK